MITGDLLRDWDSVLGRRSPRSPITPISVLWATFYRNRTGDMLVAAPPLLRDEQMFGGKTKVEAGLHWSEYRAPH